MYIVYEWCRPQRGVQQTAEAMVRVNFTLFFDIRSDGKYAQYLHSIVAFSEPDDKKNVYPGMFSGVLFSVRIAHGLSGSFSEGF